MPLFHEGTGLGLDRAGTIYVWDSLEARVKRFSPAGKLLTWWHVPGAADVGVWMPNHLAVDPQGNSAVLANGVTRFSPAGTPLAHWSVAPNAVGIAAGGSGNVFVLSQSEPPAPGQTGGHARIDKYSPQGALLTTWTTPDIAVKDVAPDGIAVDTRGNVYVTVGLDNECYRVCLPVTSYLYRFNPGGTIVWTLHAGSTPLGPVSAVDAAGNIYVLPHDVTFDHMSIAKPSPQGRQLAAWPGIGGILQDQLHVQVDRRGRIVITASQSVGLAPWQRSALLRILSPAGKQVAQFGRNFVPPTFPMNLGLTVNRAGTLLYVTGGYNNAVYTVMTASGKILRSIGNTQAKPPVVEDPRVIALDGRGNVYINDSAGGRIVKFSPSDKHLATYPLPAGYRGGADGLALDSQGNMYVTSQSHVLKLSPAGVLLANIGGPGTVPGQFGGPGDVAVDGQGNIYVADTYNDRIQKLSPAGAVLAVWGGPQQFDRPIRLALDPSGNVWVADLTHSYLQELSPSGVFIGRYGQYGVFPGQLYQVDSLSFDRRGNLFVLDYGNNRIQERTSSL
jgi:sugar lactone lactonase YvrE